LAEQPVRFIGPATLKFDHAEQMDGIELLLIGSQHQLAVKLGFAEAAAALRLHRLPQRSG
jgi:hypothetical protein